MVGPKLIKDNGYRDWKVICGRVRSETLTKRKLKIQGVEDKLNKFYKIYSQNLLTIYTNIYTNIY